MAWKWCESNERRPAVPPLQLLPFGCERSRQRLKWRIANDSPTLRGLREPNPLETGLHLMALQSVNWCTTFPLSPLALVRPPRPSTTSRPVAFFFSTTRRKKFIRSAAGPQLFNPSSIRRGDRRVSLMRSSRRSTSLARITTVAATFNASRSTGTRLDLGTRSNAWRTIFMPSRLPRRGKLATGYPLMRRLALNTKRESQSSPD